MYNIFTILVGPVVVLFLKTFKLYGFLIFWLSEGLMKIIPETLAVDYI
jgi:hypothetical protein